MSQKRVMQLVISRIGQLNGTLSRIENVLIDAFLELAARADPEKTGLAAEDAEVRRRHRLFVAWACCRLSYSSPLRGLRAVESRSLLSL